ncbi:hypothetical protein [Mesorhizobium sp. BR1-1-16]|nr:hypothetical protein [Mesorhizobium sp. BR1-1-16]
MIPADRIRQIRDALEHQGATDEQIAAACAEARRQETGGSP